jgi:lipopolysaccharide biosynthesis protein
MSNVPIRALAFYLPAFYPIPENDQQWGVGFTEWHNVVRGEPLFRGHYQPHVPADLGYYDLRLAETRVAQAKMAEAYGIHGFVYYHYWFHGKRLLERPFDEVLASRQPDLPFALCWANESWTRRWDGGSDTPFVEQSYSDEDDLQHIEALLPALRDDRYICVEGKPLVLVYRASLLPAPSCTMETWRLRARAAGLPGLYLCRVEAHGEPKADPRRLGFDAAIEFQPDFGLFGQPKSTMQNAFRHAAGRLHYRPEVHREDYATYIRRVLSQPLPPYPRHPGVCPSWDNSARMRRTALAFVGSRPDLFEWWIVHTVRRSTSIVNPDLLFVNAWNEWGEACHLEPDRENGRAWLEALQRALSQLSSSAEARVIEPRPE